MSSSVEDSSNPVSKAISDAAAANSSAQTRFSFYDAQEVELQISASENKEGGSESMKDSSNPENSNAAGNHSFSNINATGNNYTSNNNSKQSSRKELATVDNNTIGLDVPISAGSATSTSINNITINTNMPTVDSQATEDILRSLQETEEQRMQLLGGDGGGLAMPATVGTAAGITGASSSGAGGTAEVRKQGFDPQEIISVDQSSIDSNSNPYEDAIKEALDLLRRHRSPAASPAFANKVAESFASDNSTYPQTVALTEGAGIRPRTPRDNTAAPASSASADIPTTREELTDAYEEARLKAKQRQERMAKYASRLQEFKSGMTTTPSSKATPTNINNISNTAAWQVTHSTEQEEDGDHVVIHTTTNNKDYSDTIRQVGTNDDSVGFSDLSQSTKQREEEVQRGVEKVLLAILEKANSSRGRAVQHQHHEQHISNYAPQSSLQSHYSQDSMGDTLIQAMDELLLGPQPNLGQQQLQPPQTHLHDTVIDPLKNAASRDSGMDSVNTGALSKNSKSVVDELLAEVDDDDNVVSVPSALDMTSPTSTGPALMGKSWGDTTDGQQQQHQHLEEKKLPDSTEKDNDDPLNTTLNAVMLHRADEEQSDFHNRADVEDLVHGFLSSEKDLGVDSGEDAIIVIDDYEADQVDIDEHDRYAELAGDDDNDQIEERENSARVLGPLSMAGGTTGVVLDVEEVAEHESHIHHHQQQDDSNEDSRPFSHAVDALAPEQREAQERYAIEQQEKQHREAQKQSQDAKDSSSDESEEENDSDDDDDDDDSTNGAASNNTESMELMRTLCAHLLPFGVDQSNSLLDAIPDWDEENPNEAGYRIIRLSRAQLRSVEFAFETMIKATSERRLNGIDPNAEGNDANFVKELQEAEKLLDDEEKRLAESNLSSASSVSSKSNNKAPLVPGALQIDGENDDKESMVDGSSSALCHPDFPGIRATGKGEMGDLEYFHLPVIFKSHVTGFEPTKDLVLEPGNVVASQYLVESELGSAAFSTAYRCVDLSSDGEDGHEEVCLKVIKNTKDFFDQSLDEIKILELLRQTGQCHENHCVEMKTFFYYREHLVIVTELLRQNLFEFGKFILDNDEEAYFTVSRLAYITRQALISLKFVHSLGLVHSDVKPENILLGSYSRAQIKLIDFGSSCYLTDRQSSYIQSRSYRAPEVVLGLPYDGRIDVWSLGCVVAEMYTGEVTFQNDSIVSMLSRIEAICGPFPRHMIAQGRQSGRFFTKSGLLYEFVDDSEREGSKSAPGPHDDSDDENDSTQFDIFQPKKTRVASRLGFAADLMDDGFNEADYNPRHSISEREEEIMFTDFVSRLLTIDPDGRPSAAEALKHPWMQYAATLTEEEIKYPSS